jgi:hypothetical protein
MNIRELSEVSARLEESVARHSAGLSNRELYDLFEQTAITVLDSEWMDFADGELEQHLHEFLARKRLELRLPPE